MDHIRVNLLLYKRNNYGKLPTVKIVVITRTAVTVSRLRAFSQLNQHQNIAWSTAAHKLNTVRDISFAKSVNSKKKPIIHFKQ